MKDNDPRGKRNSLHRYFEEKVPDFNSRELSRLTETINMDSRAVKSHEGEDIVEMVEPPTLKNNL